jgi:hypothetical protein
MLQFTLLMAWLNLKYPRAARPIPLQTPEKPASGDLGVTFEAWLRFTSGDSPAAAGR